MSPDLRLIEYLKKSEDNVIIEHHPDKGIVAFYAFGRGRENLFKYQVGERVSEHSYKENSRLVFAAEEFLRDTCAYSGMLNCNGERKDLAFEDYIKSYLDKHS